MILNKKIAFLSSSRADYGILSPLIDLLIKDKRFDITLIVFGMHLEEQYGFSKEEITYNKNIKIKEVKCMPKDNKPKSISKYIGKIIVKFSNFWSKNKYDLVVAIGDRYEMFASVQSTVPFGMKILHIHGGETSLGSIDNIFRDQITLASSFHLTSNEHHSKKIKRILNSDNNIFNIGSLSLLNLKNICIPNWNKICDKLKLKKQPFILYNLLFILIVTINPKNNFRYLEILKSVFENISSEVNLLITSSNADTYGDLYNNLFYNLSQKHPKRIFFVKILGKLNYFSAIKNCEFVLGNSSSGIIEAASFKK